MSSDSSTLRPLATNPLRVLVVDDSRISRTQLQETLVAAGIEVVEAEDGQEALWRARTERFNLVLTDIHMPVMDGLQLCQRLRELKGYEKIPVLVLTSDRTRERVEEGRKVGVTGWMTKPTKLELLAESVRHAIFKS